MKMTSIAARLVRAAAATALLAGPLAAGPAAAEEKMTIRLDFSPWGVHAGMHLAKEKGWFKDAGLDVDIQDGRGSGNTLQLVNAGQADVGQIQVGLLPQARENGSTAKAFAGFDKRTDLAVEHCAASIREHKVREGAADIDADAGAGRGALQAGECPHDISPSLLDQMVS